MGAVNGEVVVEAEPHFAVASSSDGSTSLPEQSVMDEEEINFSFDGLDQNLFAGIDGRADAVDLSRVFNLEAIPSTGVILNAGRIQGVIQPGGEF